MTLSGVVRRIVEGASAPAASVGRLSVETWISLFWNCHNVVDGAVCQWCWPENRPLMDQDAVLVAMFRIIRAEAQGWVNDKRAEATAS